MALIYIFNNHDCLFDNDLSTRTSYVRGCGYLENGRWEFK